MHGGKGDVFPCATHRIARIIEIPAIASLGKADHRDTPGAIAIHQFGKLAKTDIGDR